MSPLTGVCVEERRAIHLTRWAVPVGGKRQWYPACLRTEFFLTDVVTPTAARLTNTTTHHQHIDDATVIHIHVIPVVQCRADNHHALAVGLVGVLCKFTRDLNHHFGFDTRVFFLPFWRIGDVLHVIGGNSLRGKFSHTTVNPVVCHH